MPLRKILVLGSGLVARPCVEYLCRDRENHVTVGRKDRIPENERLHADPRLFSLSHAIECRGVDPRPPHTSAVTLDVASSPDLDPMIESHDLVISLVPFNYHAAIIRSAIRGQTNVVTTSYISPAMRELDTEARNAGIVVLNEVGVDPGVDHLYAIKKIDEVHRQGGKVKEFYSYCGGIPAPEHADNPLGFKFSWSPRGALLSQCNSASFLLDGKRVDIASKDLMSMAKPYHVLNGYSFVAYPNRNSVPFQQFYGIPEADTVVRGSLRYEGNPQFVRALNQLGWLDPESKDWLKPGLTWAEVQQQAIGATTSTESSLVARIMQICQFPTAEEGDRIVSGLRWFGIFSSDPARVEGGNLLDTLAGRLEHLLSYQTGERDLVMLQHKFIVEWQDGTRDTMTSTLELFGDPQGYSGMAKSVGTTCGIATQLLLDGHPSLTVPGVHAPYTVEMCDPIRRALEHEGITMVETTH